MPVMKRFLLLVCTVLIASASTAHCGVIEYLNSPGAFPLVTSSLSGEFGTSNFPPLAETTQSFYQVDGSGPVELTFRFKADTGLFRFAFGYYLDSPGLRAIDLSTLAGKQAYAAQALAPGNATLIFNDSVDDPGAIKKTTVAGGTVLGFFLIPDGSLALFQSSPGSFAINGFNMPTFGHPPLYRWPLFGVADANPGGEDQLLSFAGLSAVTGKPTNLFAWEDLTRAAIAGNPLGSDNTFNDLAFAVEGIAPVAATVPEPASLVIFGLLGLSVGARQRTWPVGWLNRRRRLGVSAVADCLAAKE